MAEPKPVIEFEHVNKIYSNGVVGLKDIELTIMPGEFVVVVGLSGAGKSTLMRAVNRLHDISTGDIRIDGESITKARGKQLLHIRRKIGMIFQNFNLVKRATVLKNVLTGRVGYYPTWKMLFGLFSAEDKQRAYEALQTVELEDKVYTRADQLSGGQQQRVSIARALTQSPRIILADEPIASLDPQTTKRVMDDLRRINQELGITVLINLHNVELALEYGTRIVGIRAGEKVFDGPVADADAATMAQIYTGQEEG
ncbi:phosphonate ABC transporter ATP-binding protein [Lacticaseibacillus daqingensis]|uniref:phosphonate ABC transporter ATP-binding protein n=1 Tax=Lacticaseibacillus daqingensis TaxID=2486014 RepID=UPI000F7A245D|nr:phosphonate ABC transporter ATP-binding protein [Lacticaseibacillus daqingensis]